MSEGLPEGWATAKLGSLAIKVGSGATPRGGSSAYHATGVPLIRSMNVHFAGFNPEGLVYLNDDQVKALGDAVVETGDVLLNITGASIGRVSQVPPELAGACVNQHVCIIRPHEGHDPSFLAKFLSSPETQKMIWSEQYGVTRQALTKGQILNFDIPVPPLPEQRRIVAKLEALLGKVAQSRARLARIPTILKRFRQSVLAAACSGRLTADWREENDSEPAKIPQQTSSRPLPTIKKEELFWESPRSWEWCRLGVVAEFINGDRGKNYPNRREYVQNGIPFINTGHIEPDGSLSLETMNYISEAKFNSLGSGKIKSGDLVYCLRGATLGKTAFVEPFKVGAIASSLVIIRSAPVLNRHFAYFYLTSPFGKELVNRFDNGSAQPNLSAESVKNYVVPIPPAAEQEEIVCRVKLMFSFADQLEARLATATAHVEKLTQSILAKAFCGELVPTEAELARRAHRDYEPAATLLTRLQQSRAAAATTAPKRKTAKRTAKAKHK